MRHRAGRDARAQHARRRDEPSYLVRTGLEVHRHHADLQPQPQRLVATRRRRDPMAQHPRGAEDRMAAEGDLACGRVQAHAVAAAGIRRRRDERGLGEVHLGGHLLHRGIAQRPVVGDHHRERVARIALRGEHVDDEQAMRHARIERAGAARCNTLAFRAARYPARGDRTAIRWRLPDAAQLR